MLNPPWQEVVTLNSTAETVSAHSLSFLRFFWRHPWRSFCALFFTSRWKNFGLEWRSYKRVFCQILVVVSRDEFCFFQRGSPPLNLKIFISSDAFDNSLFFDEQPKFAWFVCVVIAAKICSEIDAASRNPISLYDTLELSTHQAFAAC